MNASFYDAWRESLLAVDATDADIDALAVYWVDFIVECTTGQPEERDSQFELIVNHLALADMNIRIRPAPACGPTDVLVRVEFPTRPKVH